MVAKSDKPPKRWLKPYINLYECVAPLRCRISYLSTTQIPNRSADQTPQWRGWWQRQRRAINPSRCRSPPKSWALRGASAVDGVNWGDISIEYWNWSPKDIQKLSGGKSRESLWSILELPTFRIKTMGSQLRSWVYQLAFTFYTWGLGSLGVILFSESPNLVAPCRCQHVHLCIRLCPMLLEFAKSNGGTVSYSAAESHQLCVLCHAALAPCQCKQLLERHILQSWRDQNHQD